MLVALKRFNKKLTKGTKNVFPREKLKIILRALKTPAKIHAFYKRTSCDAITLKFQGGIGSLAPSADAHAVSHHSTEADRT